ncbi:hypothetical protein KY290_003584 [Solanum tuberosum]|uniref:Cysteine-rich transmembrane domain-containing protein n=1 Tax=Solanum tuberosum TaxID=4113 RepID=A0ABQ7WTB9_SOLTU|nr:hypothetical protein KY284_003722 [Solanum tuberosum]KAH0727858.1 hypothetical protein KY284_003723 [Solanum tuberosum]KAH0732736.1 hypothetical protein KY289_003924 [Solanum tuberosum]KAH0767715.1 hypothetical protein KY285_003586 [Solanum tuberosum]KAH0783986.1 hypothetical protein KY290_003584 [Solanum tuberosum]
MNKPPKYTTPYPAQGYYQGGPPPVMPPPTYAAPPPRKNRGFLKGCLATRHLCDGESHPINN